MAAYDGPIVDIDIHHRPRSDAELVPYLAEHWRVPLQAGEWKTSALVSRGGVVAGLRARPGPLKKSKPSIDDGFGGRAGTEYQLLREDMLDEFDYHAAVLTHNLGQYGAHPNPELGAALCSAANDWNADTWLKQDDRLYSVIVVPSGTPAAAAAEIRRMASHPRMIGVLLAGNVLGRPFGDPVFDPIYDAACEVGLPVSMHVALDRPTGQMRSVGGAKVAGMEELSQFSLQAQHWLASFISQGTFERFPALRLLVLEYGISWVPWLMYSLDREVELLRQESRWVKRLPSEYIRERVRFSTQPIEEGPDKGALLRLLDTVDGMDDLLCFSTDYPHPTFDDPMYVARLLPKEWHRKVFVDNACAWYGLPLPSRATPDLARA